MLRLMPSRLMVVVMALAMHGCVAAPPNAPLASFNGHTGYRYTNFAAARDRNDGLFVALSFSGGGTRSAAFAYGVMEALRDTRYKASQRTLLNDVDIIYSVSGGSFTAAYYALFRDRFFVDFPSVFLERDIQTEIVKRSLWPANWYRLLSPTFNRTNLAAEVYNDVIFQRKTFGDLLRIGQRPFVLMHATDMTLGQRFEFTQDQFDLICSDLSHLRIADAVAASAAFPVLLSPVVLRNYNREGCHYRPPRWLQNAMRRGTSPPEISQRAEDLMSYQHAAGGHDYVHLLDGGIADNIGLRGFDVEAQSPREDGSLAMEINQAKIRRVVVIAVDAKTKPVRKWNSRPAAPGLLDVIYFTATTPMDRNSADTIVAVRRAFEQQFRERRVIEECEQLLRSSCPGWGLPFGLPQFDFHPVVISPDALGDDKELRACLKNLPTSFKLPAETVTLLRQAAGYILNMSPDFRRAMVALDPAWQPIVRPVDRDLMARVCDR